MSDDDDTVDRRGGDPGDDRGSLPVGRRELLVGVPAAGVALAGCYVALDRLDGGGRLGGDDGTTPTYGYGGTPTTTAASGTTAPDDDGAAGDATDSPEPDGTTDSGATNTPTETQTSGGTPPSGSTATRTPTDATAPADDYGLQGYGQYGYGG